MFRLLGRLAALFLLLSFFSAIVGIVESEDYEEAETPYLLSLPDLSSPRATLQTLLQNGEAVEKSVLAHGMPWLPDANTLRLSATVNVNDIAASRQELQSLFAASRLKEVFDHLELPAWEDIPDAAAVKAQNITEWRVPKTAIVIAKVTSGPRAGQFLFSPETVAHSAELYEAAEVLPRLPGRNVNLYAQYRYRPGPMVPHGADKLLPGFLLAPIFGQSLWQWLSAIAVLGATGLCMLRVAAWGVGHDARAHGVLHRYGQPLAALAIIGLTIYVELLVESGIGIWGQVLETLSFAFELIGLGACAWLVIALIMRVSEAIISAFTLRSTSFDAQVIRVIAMLLAICVGLGTLFLYAEFVGVPVGPLLGGLGIGGIAVALAVRPTLENVIGGLTLFADRPARVGDNCQIGNQSGTIEEIGVRTTKLRRRDDTVVTISNAEVAQARIENLSRRRKTAYDMVLRLRYDTTMEQFHQVATGIRDLLENHEKIIPGSERVRLSALGDYGLELEVRAYIDEVPNNSIDIVEELNWGVMDAMRGAGANLAHPSHDNYLIRGQRLQDAAPSPGKAPQKVFIE